MQGSPQRVLLGYTVIYSAVLNRKNSYLHLQMGQRRLGRCYTCLRCHQGKVAEPLFTPLCISVCSLFTPHTLMLPGWVGVHKPWAVCSACRDGSDCAGSSKWTSRQLIVRGAVNGPVGSADTYSWERSPVEGTTESAPGLAWRLGPGQASGFRANPWRAWAAAHLRNDLRDRLRRALALLTPCWRSAPGRPTHCGGDAELPSFLLSPSMAFCLPSRPLPFAGIFSSWSLITGFILCPQFWVKKTADVVYGDAPITEQRRKMCVLRKYKVIKENNMYNWITLLYTRN